MPKFLVIAQVHSEQAFAADAPSAHEALAQALKAKPGAWSATKDPVRARPTFVVELSTGARLQVDSSRAPIYSFTAEGYPPNREYLVLETRVEVTSARVNTTSPEAALREVQNGLHAMKEHSSERTAIEVRDEWDGDVLIRKLSPSES